MTRAVTEKGAALARIYHEEVVAPLLARHAPGVAYAAARLGSGSDVQGRDDEQSRDHDWGLRLTVLVEDGAAEEIDALLERELPKTWRGLPTRFATTWEPTVRQRCETASAADFAASRTGLEPMVLADGELSLIDWLSLTGQSVLEVTGGPVFDDGTGAITAIREHLAWYPDDLWLHLLSVGWCRMGEEFPFAGRAGLRGDEPGSAVIAARLVRVMMNLAHLMHRRWAPYAKWLGASTAALPGGEALSAAFTEVLHARTWQDRQAAQADAAELLVALQAAVGLPSCDQVTEPFFERPHHGLRDVPALLRARISDAEVLSLPDGAGSVEQITDSVKVLVDPTLRRRLVGG